MDSNKCSSILCSFFFVFAYSQNGMDDQYQSGSNDHANMTTEVGGKPLWVRF